MFDVKLFKPDDFLAIDPHEVYIGDVLAMRDHVHQLATSPNCFTGTLFLDGKPEGMVGMTLLWPGNADCWTLLSKKACKHPLALQKTSIKLINAYADLLQLKRLSAGSRADNKMGHRWIRSLGFQFEGTMRKYGPDGSDWHLFARIF